MSEFEQRVDRVRSTLDAADEALLSLPKEVRAEGANALVALEAAVSFTRAALDATDAVLVTDAAETSIVGELNQIVANAATAASGAAYANDLMAAALLLPASRGRDVEQTVREAAANYQRAMAQRIRALEDQIQAAETLLATTRADIASADENLQTVVTETTSSLQTQIAALEAAVAGYQATLDAQLTRHSDAFTTAQEEYARRIQTQVDLASDQLDEMQKTADETIAEHVKAIEKIAKNVGVLAGAIALKETADRYGDEASEQLKIANTLRRGAVAVALGAVAMAVWAVVKNANDTHALVAKLAVSSALGALATYVASQSGRHRRREVRAKDLQLQLTAFSPFVAPLHPDLQQVERVRMTRRTFGVRDPNAGHETQEDDEDYGPTFLSTVRQLLNRTPSDTPAPPAV